MSSRSAPVPARARGGQLGAISGTHSAISFVSEDFNWGEFVSLAAGSARGEICLVRVGLEDAHVARLAEALSESGKGLKLLLLGDNDFGNAGVEAIGQALADGEANLSLERLDIMGNHRVTSLCGLVLAGELPLLVSLNVSHLTLTSFPSELCRHANLPSMRFLYVSHCRSVDLPGQLPGELTLPAEVLLLPGSCRVFLAGTNTAVALPSGIQLSPRTRERHLELASVGRGARAGMQPLQEVGKPLEEEAAEIVPLPKAIFSLRAGKSVSEIAKFLDLPQNVTDAIKSRDQGVFVKSARKQ